MAVTETNGGRTIAMTAATDEYATAFTAERVRWVSKAATAGDDLLLVETTFGNGNNSNTIWESVADGANYVEESFNGTYFPHGIRINTIDSGTLYIYVARRS